MYNVVSKLILSVILPRRSSLSVLRNEVAIFALAEISERACTVSLGTVEWNLCAVKAIDVELLSLR